MRRETLQWFGLLGAPLAWTLQLVFGYGLTEAACAEAGTRWGLDPTGWEIALAAGAGAIALAAELSAVVLWRETRRAGESGPPLERLHFFAVASMAVGIVFLGIIVLSAIGAVHYSGCEQG
jgi:hypothetical protein